MIDRVKLAALRLTVLASLFSVAAEYHATVALWETPSKSIGIAEHERIAAKLSLGKAFAQYQKHMEKNERFQAQPYAKRVYELASLRDNEVPKNARVYAAAAHNLGRLFVSTSSLDEAQKHMKEALATLEKLHGTNSLDLLDVLMDLGIATSYESNKYWSKQYFSRAIEIATANSSENSDVVAQLYYEISGHASVFGEKKSIEMLQHARTIFSREFGDDHARTALASYRLGLTHSVKRDYSAAAPLLEQAVGVFDQQSPLETYTIEAHSALVRAYENLGKGNLATKHCRAIGRIKEARKEAFPTGFALMPLHQIQITYPRRENRMGIQGFAILELTVDIEGRTKDLRILQWGGSEAFGKTAMRSAKEFRYPVQFKDGTPVETQGVRYKFTFNLAN